MGQGCDKDATRMRQRCAKKKECCDFATLCDEGKERFRTRLVSCETFLLWDFDDDEYEAGITMKEKDNNKSWRG